MNPQSNKILWLWYAGAAILGICIGAAALFLTVPEPESADIPQVSAETTCETQTEEPTQAAEEPPAPLPAPWNLLLVNPWNRLPEDFSLQLLELESGHALDARAAPDLLAMMADMQEMGLNPLICSSYRTQEKQESLYSRKVEQYLEKGCSQPEAEAEAGKWVAVPGTSEHQTGLALDIVDIGYPYLDQQQENTAVQQWLMQHSWEYGFILRYPSDKSEITGIYYEPWHYRYVGKEAAKEIYEQGICLEEYLETRRSLP